MKPHHDNLVLHYSTDLRQAWGRLPDLELGEKIPGFKTSAVFFASLRANILLADTSLTPLPSPHQAPALSHHAEHYSYQARPCLHQINQAHEPPPPSTLLLTSKHNAKSTIRDLHLTPPLGSSIDTASSTSTSSSSTAPASPRKARPSTPPSPSGPPLRWLPIKDDSPTKHRALALLASTVSEQRHMAYRSLVTHPLNILLWFSLLFLARKTLCFFNPVSCQNLTISERKASTPRPTRQSRASNASPICGIPGYVHQHQQQPESGEVSYNVHRSMKWFPVHIVCAWLVITLVLVLAARFASWMYRASAREITSIPSADDTDTGWLGPDDEIVVGTTQVPSHGFADYVSKVDIDEDITGVAILTWIPGSNRCATRRKKVGKAFIRGWAVRADHRGEGIGRALLKEVAKVCIKERSAEGVWFCEDFAHAHRPLHSIYNKPFDRRDLRGRQTLASVVDEVTHRSGPHAYSHSHSNSNGAIRKR